MPTSPAVLHPRFRADHEGGKVKVSGVPIPNALLVRGVNTAKPPFDNVKLRQAIAWAMPYEQIQSSALLRARRSNVWRRGGGLKAGVAATVSLMSPISTRPRP